MRHHDQAAGHTGPIYERPRNACHSKMTTGDLDVQAARSLAVNARCHGRGVLKSNACMQALERIEEQTREMRDAAARRKAQREAQAAQQRDKLKEAFLKKQLAAKLASMRKAAAATGAQVQAGNSSEAPG